MRIARPPVLNRSYLQSRSFWLALVGLVVVTDLIPVYFAFAPPDWPVATKDAAVLLGQITVVGLQVGALIFALWRGRQYPALRLGVLLGLLVADVVLPLAGLGAILLALANAKNF